MMHFGVVVAERGAAIVGLERDAAGALLVTSIERLPADISAVAARLASFDPEARVTVDGADLGTALWAALSPPKTWTLYTGRGFDRQALVDRLLVAVHADVFRFAPDLPEQESMSKALVAYRRTVREDGVIGSELVVALLLALIPAPKPQPPLIVAWA